MHLTSKSFNPYAFLDPKYAFGKHDADSHFALAGNVNPHLAWTDVPDDAKSFALICVDVDAPEDISDANTEGKTIPVDALRVDFYHWCVANIPLDVREIAEGAHSSGITPRGKDAGKVPGGGRAGLNDYTDWFAEDDDMSGEYGGYDGPAPPWNDERVHAYRFQVYALDVAKVKLEPDFDGDELMEAIEEHVIDTCEIIGLYAINPNAKK